MRGPAELVARGVSLALGRTVYDPTGPMGKMLFNILVTFAEFELDLLRTRTCEAMAIARENGRLKGRAPKLTAKQNHLVQQHESAKHTIAELGELFNVSRATVYRTIERTGTA